MGLDPEQLQAPVRTLKLHDPPKQPADPYAWGCHPELPVD